MVDLSDKPGSEATEDAWPQVMLNGRPVFPAYMAALDEIERRIRAAAFLRDDLSAAGQEAYLGWSSKLERFVSGWDWWYANGILTGYAVLAVTDDGKLTVTRVGFIETRLYGGGGLERLKSEFQVDHDLRLD